MVRTLALIKSINVLFHMKIKYVMKCALKSNLLLLSLFFFTEAQAQNNPLPQRIVINPLESGHTGVAITWRNEMPDNDQYIQWSIAHAHPVEVEAEANSDRVDDMSTFQKKKANTQKDTVHYKDQTSIFTSCRVTLSGLTPGETYMYRVGGDAGGWSEWIQFDLPSSHPDSTMTFIYLGDPQNDLRSQWSRTIREAYATAPQSDFIMYAGDLVNNGYNDAEWKDWYDAGGFIHSMVPSISTPGNHEYTDVILTPLWRSHFSLPGNGPEGIKELEGACFYVDYPAVRVISLDGEQIDENPQYRLAMVNWLRELLEETTQKWVVMTMHYPFYHTNPRRNNPKLRKAFKPLVDEFGVDLILQGHDHGYGRGMLDETADGPSKEGTMYVVSVSGPKVYEVGYDKWMQKRGENIQLYQVIELKGDQLFYKAYTTDGELFDSFVLEKMEKGSRLVEE